MADLTITTTAVVWVSGAKNTLNASETVTAGDWLYSVSSTTVGVASNADAAKDVVVGMALNDAVTGQPVTYAKNGAVVAMGSIITVAMWYVLSGAGATSPVADQTTSDYVSAVAYGVTATEIKIAITNTGLQAP